MRKTINIFLTFTAIFICFLPGYVYAAAEMTHRAPEFSNNQVNVWKTTVYPSGTQILKMHRHLYDRVLVSFDDGLLKIKNDKGKIHYLKLQKNKAYFLKKDVPGELHTDENIRNHPIQVMVIELKS